MAMPAASLVVARDAIARACLVASRDVAAAGKISGFALVVVGARAGVALAKED